MLRITLCVDSRLTDGCKVFSFMNRPRSTTQKQYFSASGTHFYQRLKGYYSIQLTRDYGEVAVKILVMVVLPSSF
jgi:hypothetical protein